MADRLNWLEEVVVVYDEFNDAGEAGQISVYRSEREALSHLEPWAVENAQVYAFTATGIRLELGISDERVVITRRDHCAEGPEIVLQWLTRHAQVVLDARRRESAKGRAYLSRAEEEGDLPTSTEGLLAYIGFPWSAGPRWFLPSCLLLLALIAALLAILAF